MSSSEYTAEELVEPSSGEPDRARRRTWVRLLAGGAAMVAIVAAVLLLRGGSSEVASGARIPTSLATITEQTLTSQISVDGILGYGDPVTVRAAMPGTLTDIAAVGSTVERGETLFSVDGRSVPLLYGTVPLWGALGAGLDSANQPADVRDATTALREAEANLALQQQRLSELLGGASDPALVARLAAAEQAVARAEGQVASAREHLDSLLHPDDDVVAAAHSTVLQRENALRQAEQHLAALEAGPTGSAVAAADAAVATAESRLIAAAGRLQQARTNHALASSWAEVVAQLHQLYVDGEISQDDLLQQLMNPPGSPLDTSVARTEAEAEFIAARAQLAQAQAAREELDVPADPVDLAVARNEIALATEDLRRAREEFDRLLALWSGTPSSAATESADVQAAQRQLAEAEAAQRAAEADLASLLAGPRGSEIASAQLAVLQAERQVAAARERLDALGHGATSDEALVRQLQENLAALGYAGFDINGIYDEATAAAVRAWQADLGVPVTGIVEPGQAVFLPGPARIVEHAASPGDATGGGTVLHATSNTPVVTIALDPALQSRVDIDDPVTVTLPGRQTTEGVVSSIGSVATASGGNGATIAVEVALSDPSAVGRLDQAPVSVAITTARVDALVVPVTALVALPGGGHGVEVQRADGTREIVPVTTGLFDDSRGLVAISGEGIEAGLQVVVPGR